MHSLIFILPCPSFIWPPIMWLDMIAYNQCSYQPCWYSSRIHLVLYIKKVSSSAINLVTMELLAAKYVCNDCVTDSRIVMSSEMTLISLPRIGCSRKWFFGTTRNTKFCTKSSHMKFRVIPCKILNTFKIVQKLNNLNFCVEFRIGLPTDFCGFSGDFWHFRIVYEIKRHMKYYEGWLKGK